MKPHLEDLITKLNNQKTTLPKNGYFGDDLHKDINQTIEILKKL